MHTHLVIFDPGKIIMADYGKFTDQELTDLLRSGDRMAFTEIYNRYNGILYVYAFKLTADNDAAKDMAQEIFISLWDKRADTAFKISLAAYLYSSIRYSFLKQVAHQKVRQGYANEFLHIMQTGLNTTEDYITEKELAAKVETLVSALPPKMARVFILSKLKFQTNEQIAKELNISEKTVKNLLSMAVKQVKSNIGVSILTILLLS